MIAMSCVLPIALFIAQVPQPETATSPAVVFGAYPRRPSVG